MSPTRYFPVERYLFLIDKDEVLDCEKMDYSQDNIVLNFNIEKCIIYFK